HASSSATACSLRPLMPPAALISSIASMPALRMSVPGSARLPVYGPVMPTLIGVLLVAGLPPPPPHAASARKAPSNGTRSARDPFTMPYLQRRTLLPEAHAAVVRQWCKRGFYIGVAFV